jgi:hypothetical protein
MAWRSPEGIRGDDDSYLHVLLNPDQDAGEVGYLEVRRAIERIEADESYRTVARDLPNLTRQTLMTIHKREVYLNHRSAGYEPAGITCYPIPLSRYLSETDVTSATETCSSSERNDRSANRCAKYRYHTRMYRQRNSRPDLRDRSRKTEIALRRMTPPFHLPK